MFADHDRSFVREGKMFYTLSYYGELKKQVYIYSVGAISESRPNVSRVGNLGVFAWAFPAPTGEPNASNAQIATSTFNNTDT